MHNKDELIDKLGRGKLTRRQLHKALAAFGIAAVTMPLLPRTLRAAAEDHPVVFGWEGYEEEGLHGKYIAKYGAPPNFSFWGDEDEAFAKIQAGFKPDLSMPCSYKIPKWRDAGILQPIDTGRLSNWGDIVPSLKDVPGIVVNGQRHWVCMDWGQTSVIYREDLVQFEEESWQLLWDQRYSGRLSMMDSLIDGVMVAAIVAGAKDPFNMTKEEVKKTRELLAKQLPLLRYYANSPTDIQQALASGEIVAGVGWNDAYTALRGEGVPVKFMKPKEGAMTWTCGLSIMAGTDGKRLERAYEVIDSMLSAEAGAYEMTEFGFGHANRKAYDQISEDVLAERGLSRDPDRLLKSGIFQRPIGNEPELQAMFEEVKAGL